MTVRISIIIPTLNEEEHIGATLASIRDLDDLQIIVVDGGSRDRTRYAAAEGGAQVITSAPGRAAQMNAGAAVALGDILLFLHADCRLPPDFPGMVCTTVADTRVAAGAFRLAIDGPGLPLRIIERLVQWRSVLLGLPYGDQALFLRAEIFRQSGGYAKLPIMEDFELMRRLRRLGDIRILPQSVVTSARRWQRLGIMRTTLINQLIIFAYLLGVAPERLAHWYRWKRD
jgi:rSAM/selenodomain-associated transferase 2